MSSLDSIIMPKTAMFSQNVKNNVYCSEESERLRFKQHEGAVIVDCRNGEKCNCDVQREGENAHVKLIFCFYSRLYVSYFLSFGVCNIQLYYVCLMFSFSTLLAQKYPCLLSPVQPNILSTFLNKHTHMRTDEITFHLSTDPSGNGFITCVWYAAPILHTYLCSLNLP